MGKIWFSAYHINIKVNFKASKDINEKSFVIPPYI